ncbi:MAG: SCP2 domain-containing protein [Rhodospirillales bacterium]
MESPTHGNPPLSPVLLAGIALSPLPPVLLQPFFDVTMAIISRRHPDLFDRLAGLAESTFLIDPLDLPFGFLLRPSPPPRLVAVAKAPPTETLTATIHGPLLTLIQLLDGKLDGDALFFSRDLVVEGDTEAVVTLRNAVDGAGIDVLDDLLSVLGPLAWPAGLIVGGAVAVLGRMDRDLGILGRAVLAPVADRYEAQAAELKELRATVAELRRQRDSGLRARRSRPTGTRGR